MRHAILVPALLIVLATAGMGQPDSHDARRHQALEQVQAGDFDNGRMWTFDFPPLEYWNKTYGFSADRDWLEKVRKSALRFANHCSASFVSGDGLVMTNYHCGIDAVISVTREGEDLTTQGFYAQTLEEERRVKDLYVDQLMQILDVTGEVQNAMSADDPAEQQRQKTAAIAEIEQRLGDQSGLRCQVVTLFNGGRYSAYLYKRYDDVRLVFATELPFAFFGGIWDFWSYPRYSFDFDLFRVYGDDGTPLQTDHFFRWSTSGPQAGEPVFVVGNPGRTGRLRTVSQLEFQRDLHAPFVHTLLKDRKEILEQEIRTHPERRGELFDEVFGIVNGEEAYRGRLVGLRDLELMQRRRVFNEEFKKAIEKNPESRARYGTLFEDIDNAVSRQRELAPALYGMRSQGLGVAEHISRAASLVTYALKMDDGEDVDQLLGMLKQRYAEDLPGPMDQEIMTLERQMLWMRRALGPEHPVMSALLAGRNPARAAHTLVTSSTLRYAKTMRSLLDHSPDAVFESDDPLIQAMLLAVPEYENASDENGALSAGIAAMNEQLGRALYDVYGTELPPDATFTLRISDGVLSQFAYNGTKAPMWTTFYGMYDRYYSFMGSEEAWDPMFGGNSFDLPEKWKAPPKEFDLGTPYNFVTTCDIIGGNSGSPVINTKREVVGLAHDGNFESLPGEFIFAEDRGNRTISVHSSGILEALRHIYRAERIVRELEQGGIH